jgi:hypothetical protein
MDREKKKGGNICMLWLKRERKSHASLGFVLAIRDMLDVHACVFL